MCVKSFQKLFETSNAGISLSFGISYLNTTAILHASVAVIIIKVVRYPARKIT
jgi:hypothetical protein